VLKKVIPVRAALLDPDFREVEEMDHGDGMLVGCPSAASRQDGQAEDEGIGSMALASDRASRSWDCGVRRELGCRPVGGVAERASCPGATDLSGARLAGV
jgi:hypothetical protein